MKNILEKLFSTQAVFSQYAPAVDQNKSLRDLVPAANYARKRVESIISCSVFDAILDNGSESLLFYLRQAIANCTCAAQLNFDAISRRKAEVNVYKYEIEAMERAYRENYYDAMDSLLQYLLTQITEEDDDSEILTLFKKSTYYGQLCVLPIQTCSEWDSLYPIDQSHLFFFRLIPLQRETLAERLQPYFDNKSIGENASLMASLKLALVKKTTSKALRRFDVMELPAVMRNLNSDQVTNGTRKDERESLTSLAVTLENEAEDLISQVDLVLTSESQIDISSRSAYNRPDDKIIMLP